MLLPLQNRFQTQGHLYSIFIVGLTPLWLLALLFENVYQLRFITVFLFSRLFSPIWLTSLSEDHTRSEKPLGSGSYGIVLLYENTRGEKVAVKKTEFPRNRLTSGQISEMHLSQSLSSNYLVRIYDSVIKVGPNDTIYGHTVMEYCPGGSLAQSIHPLHLKRKEMTLPVWNSQAFFPSHVLFSDWAGIEAHSGLHHIRPDAFAVTQTRPPRH